MIKIFLTLILIAAFAEAKAVDSGAAGILEPAKTAPLSLTFIVGDNNQKQPWGVDTAVGAIPLKEGAAPGPDSADFDYLLAVLSKRMYNDVLPADGKMFKLPFKGGCTALQMVKSWAFDASTQALFMWPAQRSLIFAFRGTKNFANLMTDIDFGLRPCNLHGSSNDCGKIHGGFSKMFDKFHGDIQAAMLSIPSIYKNTLFLTGHSMGCAESTLMAFYVAQNFPTHYQNIYHVGVGCPRVGDKDFAAAWERVFKGYYVRYTAFQQMGKRIEENIDKAFEEFNSKVKKLFGFGSGEGKFLLETSANGDDDEKTGKFPSDATRDPVAAIPPKFVGYRFVGRR